MKFIQHFLRLGQRNTLLLVLVSPILTFPTIAEAQATAPRFDRLSIEDGLSQSSVLALLQDHKGFVWLATQDGLNRFDGYRFSVFKHRSTAPQSLSASHAYCLLEDRENILWIGTYGGGLNRFDPRSETFSHYRHDPDEVGSLSHDTVLALHEDRQGALWVGTNGGGLNRFDREAETFVRYRHDPTRRMSLSHDQVRTLLEDRSGTLWIGTRGGLDRLDPAREGLARYPLKASVSALYEDRTGLLWVGTDQGLVRIDPTSGAQQRFRHDPADPSSLSDDDVRTVIEDRDGVLWIGTNGGGLSRFDPAAGRFDRFVNDPGDPRSLSGNAVRALMEDRTGGLWIATFANGVSKLDPLRNAIAHYRHDPRQPESLSDPVVLSLLEDRAGVLWVGTLDGGLNRFDRASSTSTHFRHHPGDPTSLSHDTVLNLYEDREGTLWVATMGGLDRFDPTQNHFVHHELAAAPSSSGSERVSAVTETPGGDLWIGTLGHGLSVLDPTRQQLTHHPHDPDNPRSLAHNIIATLHVGPTGTLWIGTDGSGFDRFDPATGAFVHHRHDAENASSLSNDHILALHESDDGTLWIGTFGGGLNRFHPQQGTFKAYREEDGLSSDSIAGILEADDGTLWISTTRGLTHFDPAAETFRTYGIDDGLQSAELNAGAAFRNRAGEMFFGGINGINAFHPRDIAPDPHPPALVFTELQLSGHTQRPQAFDPTSPLTAAISQTEHLTLTHEDYVLSIEFAALHYANPKANRYAYRLVGLDPEWIETDASRRFATYTNLAPGTYTFRAKGSNRNGVWNPEGAALTITVLPPPWRTPWAYGLYGLGISSVLLLLWQASKRRLRRAQRAAARRQERDQRLQRELEARVAERTAALERESAERRLAEEESAVLTQRLAHAQRLEMIGTLAGGIAHNFNNILTPILGYTDLVLETLPPGSPSHTHLEHVLRAANRAKETVHQILTFSRKAEHNDRPVRVSSLVDEVINLMRASLPTDIAVKVDVRSGEDTVLADPGQLHQVLLNLCTNATQSMRGQQGGTLRITLDEVEIDAELARFHARLDEGRYVRISVQDTGHGMDRATLERIFEPFFTTRPTGEGTGLGLSAAHGAVRSYGGDIEVTSREGEGSVFDIYLPRLEGAVALPASEEGPEASETLRVLLVEDDDEVAAVTHTMLARLGHQAVGYRDGREAMAALRAAPGRFDLVLTDQCMPRMTGTQLAAQVQRLCPGLPILLLTGLDGVLTSQRRQQLGIRGYVMKPVGARELGVAIARAVAAPQADAA